jgi:hypothetical protein
VPCAWTARATPLSASARATRSGAWTPPERLRPSRAPEPKGYTGDDGDAIKATFNGPKAVQPRPRWQPVRRGHGEPRRSADRRSHEHRDDGGGRAG